VRALRLCWRGFLDPAIHPCATLILSVVMDYALFFFVFILFMFMGSPRHFTVILH
jgi:hypothetical protein